MHDAMMNSDDDDFVTKKISRRKLPEIKEMECEHDAFIINFICYLPLTSMIIYSS